MSYYMPRFSEATQLLKELKFGQFYKIMHKFLADSYAEICYCKFLEWIKKYK